ncbi:MAG: winged helix-turn-helix domain-containing protein [Pseudomonadota bacterium]
MPGNAKVSRVFRALGDDTRLLILDELRQRNDQSLFELCARLIEEHGITLSRQAITRHLTTLEKAGLIETQWNGRTKVHSLSAVPLTNQVHRWLGPYIEGERE